MNDEFHGTNITQFVNALEVKMCDSADYLNQSEYVSNQNDDFTICLLQIITFLTLQTETREN